MKKYWNMFFAVILFLLFYAVISSAQTMLRYKVYWGETYEAVRDLDGTCDYQEGVWEKESGEKITVNVDCLLPPGKSRVKHAFFGITDFDTPGWIGKETRPNMWWILWGNIYGAGEDGISWTLARVDGEDASTLSVYFGQTVSSRDASLKKRCDLNKDGRIDGQDLIDLGVRFGNDMY